MRFTEHLEMWVDRRRTELGRLGEVRFRSGGDERDKAWANLVVESRGMAVDLLVWDSGEAEFGFAGSGREAVHQHHDLEQIADLEAVLRHLVGKFGDDALRRPGR